MTDRHAAHFDRMFQALADPYRRGFIEQLAKEPASVKELTDVLRLSPVLHFGSRAPGSN